MTDNVSAVRAWLRWEPSRWMWRAVGRWLMLGMFGTFLAPGESVAQVVPVIPGRLGVRPDTMVLRARNARAGQHVLDTPLRDVVYVPPKCVGKRRCPLLVVLSNPSTTQELAQRIPTADKYGMLLLATGVPPLVFVSDAVVPIWSDPPLLDDLDHAMGQVLRNFAVDPDKIAIAGNCGTGPAAAILGSNNRDVFSRVVLISGGLAAPPPPETNNRTEFFVVAGLFESKGYFTVVRSMRRTGYPVKHVLGLREHYREADEFDFTVRWLSESWAKPNPTVRPAPTVVADPLPVLTVDALARLTAFWSDFQKEPDTIRQIARRAALRDVAVPVGDDRPSVIMEDMAALAAMYPSVAAALTRARLTTREHEAYRVAVISALVAKGVGDDIGVVDPSSVLGKNMAFLAAHPDQVQALESTGMWRREPFKPAPISAHR